MINLVIPSISPILDTKEDYSAPTFIVIEWFNRIFLLLKYISTLYLIMSNYILYLRNICRLIIHLLFFAGIREKFLLHAYIKEIILVEPDVEAYKDYFFDENHIVL